jgi:hypothetical protein
MTHRRERGGKLSLPILLVAIVVVLVGTGVAARSFWSRSQTTALAQLHDLKYPLDSLLGTLRSLYFPTDAVKKETETRLRFEMAAVKGIIDRATNDEGLRSVGLTLNHIAEVCPDSLKAQLEGARKRLAKRAETIDFKRLDALVARDGAYTAAAEAFIKRHPQSEDLPRVQGWLSRAQQRTEMKELNELDALKPEGRDSLEKKRDMLRKFAEQFPIHKDVAEIKQAAELADRLLQLKTVKVKAIGAGKFNTDRSFSVKIYVDGKERLELPAVDGSEAHWEQTITFDWSVGQAIKIVLYNYTWKNTDTATLEQAGLLALRACDGHRELDPVDSWDAYFSGKPWVTFQTEDFSGAEWALIDRYVVPVSH